jgi:hypothetical protein
MIIYNYNSDGRKIIPLPESFSVWDKDSTELTLEVLAAIDVSANKYNQRMLIDMSKLTFFHAHSAILLFAHITSAQLVSRSHDFIKITLPKDLTARKLIRNSGLWDVIKYGSKRKLDKNWDTKNNFQSGYDAEKHLERTLVSLEEKYGKLPNKLGVAINEAILNISQHAYRINPPDSIKRWWQYIYIKENKLNFFIYDKGIGIPSSFRDKKLFKNKSDQGIIKEAMEKGVTSTEILGRGNGSVNIRKPVALSECDKLLIISEKGMYRFLTKDDIEISALSVKLPGTLLSWQIEVKGDDID